MSKAKYNELQLENLSKSIEEVRSVLNEVCSTIEDPNNEIRLNISRYLDDLIVEYLKFVKMKTESPNN